MACPICNSTLDPSEPEPLKGGDGYVINCARCGSFSLSGTALHTLPALLKGDADLIARVGYGVRRMQRGTTAPMVTSYTIDHLIATPLPSVFEQANNLILWLGENVDGPGETEWIEAATHQFIVGAKTERGFDLLVEHLFSTDYLTGVQSKTMAKLGQAHATLTFRGWEHFDNLKRGQSDSRKAFMAMKYGDAELDRIVADFFRPAVSQTGFVLTRLDDQPRAGLIDDRLRVEIRSSRFLIADLTHDNLGAYWEAGHAEGLGKPVIYTCEQRKFSEAKTHFDTNHHLTVVWDAENPDAGAQRLKATIRATLPDEAKLMDE